MAQANIPDKPPADFTAQFKGPVNRIHGVTDQQLKKIIEKINDKNRK